MTPSYLSSLAFPFPIDLNEDLHQHLFSPNSLSSSSSSSLSYHMLCSSTQVQNGCCHGGLQHLSQTQPEGSILGAHGGSNDSEKKSNNGLQSKLWKKKDEHGKQSENNNPVKWMSSKVRLMKKTMTTVKCDDQKRVSSSSMETDNCSNSSSNSIRVCVDCNTTKTPLWRSGPKGPKTLCNACGIRQRKARRAAMAVAAVAGVGTVLETKTSSTKSKEQVQLKENKIKNNSHAAPFKKRFKFSAAEPSGDHKHEKPCFEDFVLNISKNLAFHRVFPQDEKEAAILLMALSCGLVHG